MLNVGKPSSDLRAAMASSDVNLMLSHRYMVSRHHRRTVSNTVPWHRHLLQASRATPPAAVADGNPLLSQTSRQRVQPTRWHTQHYVNPQRKYIIKTLQTVGANKAAAYLSKRRALELGTAATLENMPLGSGTGLDPVSTVVRPIEGSAGPRGGL